VQLIEVGKVLLPRLDLHPPTSVSDSSKEVSTEQIADVVTERCPSAIRCADPFYADLRIMPMLGGLRLVAAVTMPVRSA
jgi:hypothetical protein